MTRVLHLIESLGLGGAEQRLHNDVVRLQDTFAQTVVHLFPGNHFTDSLHAVGVPTIGLGLRGYRDGRILNRLWRAIHQIHPDIIHTQLFGADCSGRFLGSIAGIPVISTVQSSIYESPDPFLRSRWMQPLDQLTARMCTRQLVAVSEFVKRSLVERFHLPEERIAIIPNAVDPSPFEQVSIQTIEAMRDKLEIPERAKVLITVGKLNPPKGHRFVLEALESIRPKSQSLVWLVIGEGASQEVLQEQTAKAGLSDIVRFSGPSGDVPALLALSDLFVFPSLSEGLPFVLLEAMAAGLPCVAFRLGPMPEVIQDRETGLLAAPQSSKELAQAIQVLLTDPQRAAQMGQAGRERVRRLFHADHAANQLKALYQGMVSLS